MNYKKKAQAMIQSMIESDIIEEVTWPTLYCSRASFMVKPDGESLRMVTDYRHVNQIIDRPVWPFMSSSTIQQSIESEARYFCALDMLQGYHQVPLHEDSRDITTFIFPMGKYRFKRGPMGLKPSGDFFNFITDKTISKIEGLQKSVDDVLAQGKDIPDIEDKLDRFFAKCKEYNVVLSPKKFQTNYLR